MILLSALTVGGVAVVNDDNVTNSNNAIMTKCPPCWCCGDELDVIEVLLCDVV